LFSLPRASDADRRHVQAQRPGRIDVVVGKHLEHLARDQRDAVAGSDLDRSVDAGKPGQGPVIAAVARAADNCAR
jgi:hypothetical protein